MFIYIYLFVPSFQAVNSAHFLPKCVDYQKNLAIAVRNVVYVHAICVIKYSTGE